MGPPGRFALYISVQYIERKEDSMNQESVRRTVVDFLVTHGAEKPVSFHMPGHKGRGEIYERFGYGDFLRNIIGCDITEIPGADALTQPEDCLLQVMENYAELYGVRHTELLVNGSSTGLIASILATVPRGGKLIMGRNSHKAVFSALRLGEIEPVYVSPETDPIHHLQGAIPKEGVEAALQQHPDASAVLVTSPNYYGILSDIQEIAKVTHAAGKILIVDQAHGAHLKFFDELEETTWAAENQGADLVVNSTHKTLMSFTSTAILNVCSTRMDIPTLSETVRMLQTTSPSYLLMGSLDVNEKILRRGKELFRNWREDLNFFYREAAAIPGVSLIQCNSLDRTKISLNMKACGLSGAALSQELQKRNLWMEMTHGDYVMMMTGLGNERGDYERMLEALKEIQEQHGVISEAKGSSEALISFDLEQRDLPGKRKKIPLSEAAGKVLYDSLIPYPPGIPLACPGEVLNTEAVKYLEHLLDNGVMVIGIDSNRMLYTGKNR